MTMGNYDGAGLRELVCSYLLDPLTKEFGKQNIGLYRDDGLSCFENISGPDSEKIKKKLFKIFKSNGLSITVECNLIATEFLNVTVHLKLNLPLTICIENQTNYCISINIPITLHQ